MPDMLLKGFDDPVDAGGRAFRALLDAMANPGTPFSITCPAEHPAQLSDAAAAVLLTVSDYATPVWLADDIASTDVQSYIRFHSAAPLTDDPAAAVFAVVAQGFEPLMATRFNTGTEDYPDRSTTVIVECAGFTGGTPVQLAGPGIEGTTRFAPHGVPLGFWEEMQMNNAGFPLGIDVILTAPGHVCAIPRSTLIEVN
ncbi:MAG: phosphonate C-P lyase system protein PhnH [Rhodospirillales bacterium]|nr:phosphonate C-P lyase system protein PhnH [Rhodospirillales bacterium]